MGVGQRLQSFRAHQRRISRNHQRIFRFGSGDRIARHLQGVPRAALRFLDDSLGAERLYGGLYGICLMPDDYENIARAQWNARAHNVFNEWPATGAVQHLGELRAQSRALAGGEDNYGEVA